MKKQIYVLAKPFGRRLLHCELNCLLNISRYSIKKRIDFVIDAQLTTFGVSRRTIKPILLHNRLFGLEIFIHNLLPSLVDATRASKDIRYFHGECKMLYDKIYSFYNLKL